MKTLKIIIASLLVLTSLKTSAQCFTDIKCGAYHNIALKLDGSSWVWGAGLTGALGNNAETIENSPIFLSNNTSQKINCGRENTFIIKANGTLWGTGFNLYGQLGINSTVSATFVSTQIGTSTNWKEIVPADSFTIALKTDNTLWAWGQNDDYQMGDGTCCDNRLAPGQIGTATDWKEIAVSQVRSAFAIKNNGTLWCWGFNIAGLIGSNLQPSVPFPIQHNTDTDWASITLGNAHMLALKTNGTLWSWGSGGQGQTANDGTFGYYEPHQIGTSTWKMVVGGSNTSFGIKTDGTLWAWGQNDAGQLGIGGITANKFAPVQIGTDTNWDKVAAGYEHAVALKTDGSLWAWGDNTYGQLGNGTTTSSLVPIQIPVAGCTLGIGEFEKDVFTLSPNPASEQVTLTYSGLENENIMEIYDLVGRSLTQQNIKNETGSIIIPLNNYPSGIYVVVVRSEKGIVTQKKLIVE